MHLTWVAPTTPLTILLDEGSLRRLSICTGGTAMLVDIPIDTQAFGECVNATSTSIDRFETSLKSGSRGESQSVKNYAMN